jgi:hypothetical protein
MPNEIQYAHLDPGLTTLTARLRTGTTDVVSGIALSDTINPRWYVGSIPGGVADGDYEVVVYEGTELVGVGEYPMRWRSNAEVLPALLADIAPAVRTNLATELARMDVAVSTRAATGAAMTLTPGERTTLAAQIEAALLADGDGQAFVNAIVAAIGNVNVNQAVFVAAIRADLERAGGLLDVLPTLTEIEASAILAKQAQVNAIKAKTDLLPAAPAAVGDIPTAATVAAQVRTNLTTELGRMTWQSARAKQKARRPAGPPPTRPSTTPRRPQLPTSAPQRPSVQTSVQSTASPCRARVRPTISGGQHERRVGHQHLGAVLGRLLGLPRAVW